MFAQSSLKWVITATGPGGAPEPLRVDGDGALVVTVDASVGRWFPPMVGSAGGLAGAGDLLAVHAVLASSTDATTYLQCFDAATLPAAGTPAVLSVLLANRPASFTSRAAFPLRDGLVWAVSAHPRVLESSAATAAVTVAVSGTFARSF